MLIKKELTFGIDIDKPISFYANKNANLLALLKNRYENKCFDGVFVSKVLEIVQTTACDISLSGHHGYGTTYATVLCECIEMIKGEYFINSIELSRNTSKLAQSENNDCVVRAFMAALDISYDQAHAWVKKELHRKNNRGTMMNAFGKNIIGKTNT